MQTKPAIVLLSGLLFACAQPPAAAPPAPPPAPAAAAPAEAAPTADRFVSIRGATCDRFLALSDDDRAAASMFYMGYQASRARLAVINVAMIPSITGLATDLCAADPSRTIAGVFVEAYYETRRWRR